MKTLARGGWFSLVGAVVIVASAAPGGRALDFQVQSTKVEEDGFTREQFYVRNDERSRVLLSLPARWTRTGGPNALTLVPPDVSNSLVRLEKSTLGPDTPFAGAGLETYRRRVQADVPQGATGLQWIEEKDNPLPIFGWKDHEWTVTYEFFGQTYRRSVLYLNLDAREQLVLTCVAPAGSFAPVHEAGLDLLRSWQVVPGH